MARSKTDSQDTFHNIETYIIDKIKSWLVVRIESETAHTLRNIDPASTAVPSKRHGYSVESQPIADSLKVVVSRERLFDSSQGNLGASLARAGQQGQPPDIR